MRKLNTTDVFNLCRLVKATDAREQLRVIVAEAARQKEEYKAAKAAAEAARQAGKKVQDPKPPELLDVTQVGVDGILAIVEAAVEPKAEALVYKFLSGPLECKPEEVAAMELDALLPALKEIAEANNLTTFFDSVSGILGKG